MKHVILFLFVSLFSLCYGQDDYLKVVGPWFDFEEGATEYLYGDNVVLRKKPSTEGQAMDTLKIGHPVTILKKTNESMPFNGQESFWYKVKANGKVGYILGGLISLDMKEEQGDKVLVTLVMRKATYEEYFVRCRILPSNGEYYGHEFPITNPNFQLKVYGNKGVEGIQHVVSIDQFSEACGMEGGSIYLFDTGERLKSVLSCSSVVDGGVFWFNETLIFPEDQEYNYNKAIVFEREFGESMDEEMNWTRAIINQVNVNWNGEELVPNVREMDFEE